MVTMVIIIIIIIIITKVAVGLVQPFFDHASVKKCMVRCRGRNPLHLKLFFFANSSL